MLYGILKVLLRPALRVFYEQTDVEGREHLPETGPLVVVANHPNTLMDPLLVGMLWRRQLHFLTSSRFFRSVGGWVLRASGAIPLYRQEDHATTVPDRLTGTQRAARNDDSFRASFDLLASGGALLIFPEGSSILTRRLRPFKSGAARIALGAEARHGWQLGVQLVPVGLTYADAPRFRSSLFRRVGEPIRVADYRVRYEANPSAAIRALTEDLRRALQQQLLVIPSDAEVDHWLAVLAPWAHPASGASLLPHLADQPLGRQQFARTRVLLQTLHWLDAHDVVRAEALRRRLNTYHVARQRLGLTTAISLTPPAAGHRRRGAKVLLGALPAGFGALHHQPVFRGCAALARRLTTEVEFGAALTLALAMLLLPVVYVLFATFVWHVTHSAVGTAAYLFALPFTGWLALSYSPLLTLWRSQTKVSHAGPDLDALRTEHAVLLAELTQAVDEWQGEHSTNQ